MKTIIAGGTSGIGLATAAILANQNTDVIITGRSQEKLLEALSTLPKNVQGFGIDSSNRQEVAAFMQSTGKFDHLVLALSGAKGGGLLKELDLNVLREGFNEKFFPHLQTLQAALPFLRSGGSVTFITAVSGHARFPGITGLAAINGALESIVPVLAKELQPIRVNAVSPGVIDTAWWNFLPKENKRAAFDEYAQASLVGRVGHAQDVAQIIAQLINNTFITGQIITVDGGMGL